MRGKLAVCFGVRNGLIMVALGVLAVAGCRSDRLQDLIDKHLPSTTTTTIPPVAFHVEHWLGPNYSGAQETTKLDWAKINRSLVRIGPACPSSWPKRDDVGALVQGIICVFYERNGVTGGKFDWMRPNQTSKTTHNLRDGYNGHTMPIQGQDVWVCIVSVDGRQRSNYIKAVWE